MTRRAHVDVEPIADIDVWRQSLLEVLRQDASSLGDDGPVAVAAGLKLEVLVFAVGGERYGLDIREVAEILLPRPVTPLPRVPCFVVGVASLRGSVLPVLDLGQRLGIEIPAPDQGERIVVVRDGEGRIGFRVDGVFGVVRFGAQEIETGSAASTVDPRFLKGIVYDREGNLVALLSAEDLCAFELGEP